MEISFGPFSFNLGKSYEELVQIINREKIW